MSEVIVLDTHIWFWWLEQAGRLPQALAERIESGTEDLAISSASIYEIAFLLNRGRIAIDRPFGEWLHVATQEAGVSILGVDPAIAGSAGNLPVRHGDPLDRIIIATALYHNAFLASVDSQFPQYRELDGRLLDGRAT